VKNLEKQAASWDQIYCLYPMLALTAMVVLLCIWAIVYWKLIKLQGKVSKSTLDEIMNINEFKPVDKIPFFKNYKLQEIERINASMVGEGKDRRYYIVDAELYWNAPQNSDVSSYSGYTLFFVQVPTRIPGVLIISCNPRRELLFINKLRKSKKTGKYKQNIAEDIVFPDVNYKAYAFNFSKDLVNEILKPDFIELIHLSDEKFSIQQNPESILVTKNYLMLSYNRISEKQKIWNVISFGKHLAKILEKPSSSEFLPGDEDEVEEKDVEEDTVTG
jgi:hypothetical protein